MAADKSSKAIELTDLTSVSGEYNIIRRFETGSTGPQLIEKDGKKYVLKFSNATIYNNYGNKIKRSIADKNAHAANEYLGFKLYKVAGCNVPDIVKLVEGPYGEVGVLESFIEGDTLSNVMRHTLELKKHSEDNSEIANKNKKKIFEVVQKDLLIHALLGNWDINNSENIMIKKNESGKYEFDKPIIIDCGGTLIYRAQGKTKDPGTFAGEVINIETIIEKADRTWQRPLKNLAYMTKEKLQSLICSNWNAEKGKAILNELDIQKGTVKSYYDAVGISYDDLKRVLTERIEFINKYCGIFTKTNATNNGSGGSGASATASASSGGKRRKTRKHKHRVRKTRRHGRR